MSLTKSNLFNLVYHDDRLIYSDRRGKAVTCIDESGKQIWQYQQELSAPNGLGADIYGNIIVADFGSGKIIVISKDGQDGKVLMSEKAELRKPALICFKPNESSGYICELGGTYLAKFNISYV